MQQQYNNHVNLVIVTPGFALNANYVKSLLSTITECHKNNISVSWFNEYSAHVGDAREASLNGGKNMNINESRPFSGEISYDKILWIDSDIIWNPEDVIKIYNSEKDIISGAYLQPNGDVMAFKNKGSMPFKYEEVLKMTEIEEISSCGFGFLCVKQGVFESMERPWFRSVETEVDFGVYKKVIPINSEDVAWCYRALELGYNIWFDPTIRVTHEKTLKLTWEGISS